MVSFPGKESFTFRDEKQEKLSSTDSYYASDMNPTFPSPIHFPSFYFVSIFNEKQNRDAGFEEMSFLEKNAFRILHHNLQAENQERVIYEARFLSKENVICLAFK
ncbi:hypothetical protein CEXT_621461 [Caerostris extrusa]|uniref:Uncharacterized protein n=1 Tax=Caerostris extrusa TaxID=172846 RepID=A0AAV4NPR8_CAEEX|nr:hypothetical protein CEXT_621461 [Caerostris extrusa]